MKPALIVLFALASLAWAAAPLGAQGLTVEYVEGTVSLHAASGWITLAVGDGVAVDAQVRLNKLSLVQLKGGGATVTLSQAGTYGMAGVLAARASLRAAGAPTAVASAFSKIIRGGRVTGGAGGVRAERIEIGDLGGIIPPAGELDDGKEALARGDYGKAIQHFTPAAERDPEGEAGFCLAAAWSLAGDPKTALAVVAEVKPKGGEEWAGDYVLLRAKLLLDTFAYAPAVKILEAGHRAFEGDGERAPYYYFLLALGYQGSGDAARAGECFDTVAALAPGSDLAASAARLR
jgi:tetratricopeptide (TPR) repeat protein